MKLDISTRVSLTSSKLYLLFLITRENIFHTDKQL